MLPPNQPAPRYPWDNHRIKLLWIVMGLVHEVLTLSQFNYYFWVRIGIHHPVILVTRSSTNFLVALAVYSSLGGWVPGLDLALCSRLGSDKYSPFVMLPSGDSAREALPAVTLHVSPAGAVMQCACMGGEIEWGSSSV
ncbi:unnamed protein product [Linum trigynum]|uniref:Uncharacterized protein n=1 Tax=Linum trigynum TaxID=586398 RepID=A0AAV2DCC4_9ROSI